MRRRRRRRRRRGLLRPLRGAGRQSRRGRGLLRPGPSLGHHPHLDRLRRDRVRRRRERRGNLFWLQPPRLGGTRAPGAPASREQPRGYAKLPPPAGRNK
ncbi:MAG: hypothetical protein DRJ42_29995 [Deltaproteobacteria bacterium]|nr:MAG: hypothetical protein DRJ42_29995 [Deltaproteobacteria bacterium]